MSATYGATGLGQTSASTRRVSSLFKRYWGAFQERRKERRKRQRERAELYPLNETETSQLNYCEQLNQPHYQRLFEKMHRCGWEEMFEITDNFRLTKTKCNLHDFSTENLFYLIYFDAFAPAAQPEAGSPFLRKSHELRATSREPLCAANNLSIRLAARS